MFCTMRRGESCSLLLQAEHLDCFLFTAFPNRGKISNPQKLCNCLYSSTRRIFNLLPFYFSVFKSFADVIVTQSLEDTVFISYEQRYTLMYGPLSNFCNYLNTILYSFSEKQNKTIHDPMKDNLLHLVFILWFLTGVFSYSSSPPPPDTDIFSPGQLFL